MHPPLKNFENLNQFAFGNDGFFFKFTVPRKIEIYTWDNRYRAFVNVWQRLRLDVRDRWPLSTQ